MERDARKARSRALRFWRQGYRRQIQGDLEGAIRLYRRSLAIHPTAEAHTFLGWAYSLQGKLREAIRECQKAIEVDPSYGNPYNDIGAYLIQLGQYEEAIPWLRRAMKAERYEVRHFPHLNLGRIYLMQGKWWEALQEFDRALDLAPDDPMVFEMAMGLRFQLSEDFKEG